MRVQGALGLLVAVAVMACGGATSVLTGGDGGASAEGGKGSSSGGSGSGSGGGTSSSGGGSGSSSGGSSSGGSGSGGGSGSSSGSASGSSSGGITALGCASSCMPPAQTCCIPQNGGQPTCETGTTCSDPNATGFQCAATADCPSPQVCCLDNNTNVATCSGNCQHGGTQLCDPNAASSGCPQGNQCQPGGVDVVPNAGTCGG